MPNISLIYFEISTNIPHIDSHTHSLTCSYTLILKTHILLFSKILNCSAMRSSTQKSEIFTSFSSYAYCLSLFTCFTHSNTHTNTRAHINLVKIEVAFGFKSL